MLLALVGVTGVGKSYYKDKIVEKLEFDKVNTIRTREMRQGEQNGKSGLFMTNQELEQLKQNGEIVYEFEVFGGKYAYKKNEILSNKNMIFEMHYTTIDDWKKIRPDIKTIYIFPKDINVAISKTKERNLSKEKEIERINELKEHYNKVINDKDLQKKFDFIVYNNYDKASEDEIINLVKKMM